MKGLRAERRQQLNELVVESGIENRATACVSLPTAATLTVVEVAAELLPVAPPRPPPGIRKESPVLPVPAPAPAVVGFCHHLGVLLFSAVLLGMEKEVAAGGWLLKQWLATLLLGAVNIEQTLQRHLRLAV